jgi:hypothetical protein
VAGPANRRRAAEHLRSNCGRLSCPACTSSAPEGGRTRAPGVSPRKAGAGTAINLIRESLILTTLSKARALASTPLSLARAGGRRRYRKHVSVRARRYRKHEIQPCLVNESTIQRRRPAPDSPVTIIFVDRMKPDRRRPSGRAPRTMIKGTLCRHEKPGTRPGFSGRLLGRM